MNNPTVRIFTRNRELDLLNDYLSTLNIPFEIFTPDSKPNDEPFELGISYCYTKKILPPTLYLARKGFVNFHPAPLPEYPMGPEYKDNAPERGVKDKVMKWGVTAHYMDENYDSGPIIKKVIFDLEEPPVTKDELGSLAHWHLWKLFKELFLNIYHFSNPINEKFIEDFQKEVK
jgi:Methionyl-tRNA formyltransferase|tara:strand:- start:5898 stop:6419 length:522 start_codon:yes stop_codon:yes gene_type:complete